MKAQKSNTVSIIDESQKQLVSKSSGLRELFRTIKVKEVARKFKILAASTRYKYLKDIHFTLINDNAIFFKSNTNSKDNKQEDIFNSNANNQSSQKKQKQNLLQKLFVILFQNIPVFSPSHILKDVWDIFQIITYLILFFYIPIHVTFGLEFKDLLTLPACYLLGAQVCLDILVNFNTGFYDKGVAVKDRSQVTAHYCKNYLLKDFISIIPFILYFVLFQLFNAYKDYYPSAILLLFFIRLQKFIEIIRRLEEKFHMKPSTKNLANLFKVLFNIVFASHIFSCLWIVMAIEEKKSNHYGITWLDPLKIENSDWFIKYVYAYYFSSVTMITVGYGDVIPKTPPELILCIITMIIACGMFGYSLNQIGVIVQDVFKTDTVIRENLYVITNYMNTKNINSDLQFQVRQYLEYYLKEQSQNNTEMETKIINQLSDILRESLEYESNKFIINSPIFNPFSQELREKLVPLIKQKRSTPEEPIYTQNHLDDCCIYFVEKGIIDEFIDLNEQRYDSIKTIQSCEDGQYFGEINFFTGQTRRQSSRSRQFTKLLYIRREDFLNLLKDHNEDYEIFCLLRDKLIIYNELEVIGSKCQACFNYHTIDDCSWVHFVPDRQKVVKRQTASFLQGRKYIRRRRKLKFNSLNQNVYLNRMVAIYCEQNIQNILDLDWYTQMNMNEITNNSESNSSQISNNEISQNESSSSSSSDSSNYQAGKSVYRNETDYESEQCSIVRHKQKSSSDLFQLDDIGKERNSRTNLQYKVKLKKEYKKNSKNQQLLNKSQIKKSIMSPSSQRSLLTPYYNIQNSQLLKVSNPDQLRASVKKTTKILNQLQEQFQGPQNNEIHIKLDSIKGKQNNSSSLIQQPLQNRLIQQNVQQSLNIIIEQLLNFFVNQNKKSSIGGFSQLYQNQQSKFNPNNDSKQISNAATQIGNLIQGNFSNFHSLGNGAYQNNTKFVMNGGMEYEEQHLGTEDLIFDTINSYKLYFPHGNFQNIIECYEKITQYQLSMRKIHKTNLIIPMYENSMNENDDNTSLNKKNLLYLNQNNDSFQQRFNSSSITPSIMRRNMMQQKTMFIRPSQSFGSKNSKQMFSQQAKPINSKIQNLIEKFKIEENSNSEQDLQNKPKLSLSNQLEIIEKRKQQILKRCSVLQVLTPIKRQISDTQFTPSPTQSFFQTQPKKKISDFKQAVYQFENSNGYSDQVLSIKEIRESLNSNQSQEDEDVQFNNSHNQQLLNFKSQQSYAPSNLLKNEDLYSQASIECNTESPVKKKSLFNSEHKKQY